jgi:hypothetical protein
MKLLQCVLLYCPSETCITLVLKKRLHCFSAVSYHGWTQRANWSQEQMKMNSSFIIMAAALEQNLFMLMHYSLYSNSQVAKWLLSQNAVTAG